MPKAEAICRANNIPQLRLLTTLSHLDSKLLLGVRIISSLGGSKRELGTQM
jgi:hypothetical protein